MSDSSFFCLSGNGEAGAWSCNPHAGRSRFSLRGSVRSWRRAEIFGNIRLPFSRLQERKELGHEKTISDLPASFVGGRVRPCCLFADPFSSPIASFGTASKTGSEAIPMAPLKQHERFTLDDGPRSEIYEGGLKAIRKKYGIHSLVHMKSPSEFERAPDGGPRGIAIYEAYLVAGFRGIVPLLGAEVLGELHGLETGIHEVLYSYRFAPWRIVPEFYHLQPRDGAPLVEKPRRGIGVILLSKIVGVVDTYVSRPVSFLGEVVAKKMLMIPRRFCGVHFLMSKEVVRHSFLWGKPLLLNPFSVILRGFLLQFSMMNISRLGHKEGVLSMRLHPAIPPGNMIGDVLLVGIQQRLLNELFSLHNRVRDMAAQRDLLIQQVRVSSRWELMKEWLERRMEHWDPSEEYSQYLFWSAEPTRLADPSLRVGHESAVESRVSAGPEEICSRPGDFMGTRKFSITLGHSVCILKGPYAAILGEASTGTCGDFVFYCSEASHYRVPVLHSAFCRKPLSVLEGDGVGENPNARLTLFFTSGET
ncbi:hypothetical protein IGI04_014038 [Brassica rapa subsp. trilocularis]|uniref:Uncharacterized protein n=1 Tax=Brassica rapa subsp. trilocularis TaxID=1813537 RepID=A0ABQ7NAJ3_BRACM|nr:hypothetical protein IGI04_014038 [Brassica rapa subsp. trilocularis]